ncbi:MAG: hypothetical protein A2V77_04910 [Anaeromyxobacter sp. RBG_16_69_14]|nr:MAG: hypothetical protein A2V77_04910 [Anaeromyxobacter sp. RBG_16_69_14]
MVITAENREDVLPRFFHRSKCEAKAVSAALAPEEAPGATPSAPMSLSQLSPTSAASASPAAGARRRATCP